MNQRIVLAQRPSGWVDEACFALESCAEPSVGPEDVLLESIYLSTDPYLRGRKADAGGRIHGLGQVGDKLADALIHLLDRSGAGVQARIGIAQNRQKGHENLLP